jgi:prevent-host-death family protein
MSTETSISELKRDLSTIINRASYGKERIVIVSRGRPKAAIIGLEDLRQPESLHGKAQRTAQRMTALEAARAVRAQTTDCAGGALPDSVQELRELREERADELDDMR